MRYTSLLVFSIGFFLVACGPKINSAQQDKLENLTTKVDSIAKKVNALDSAALVQLTNDFFERKNFIQEKMTDTLEPEIIFKLDAFVQLRKEMGFIRGQYAVIKSEANILKQQLIDLNHDVSKRLVEEKRFDQYYELENENYTKLADAATKLIAGVEQGTEKYNELVVIADSVIAAYKANLNE